ncbi:HpcH/HpaI aldolase/citrate lyase family protein [Amycolatopsis sp. 3B14]|uniref:HpcH/HpaI aldolase/citrate lyase family protein n=1 Tax=Amycolatopsis sp. 3B14 TaxID=3243600 RepID=UPI003D97992F
MPDRPTTIVHARSLLFVPAHRPERFDKARRSGADAIVLDLEDGVADNLKDTARKNVNAWLADGRSAVVRINATETEWFDEDVEMLRHFACTVMLPKAESAAEIASLHAILPDGSCMVPLLETATGILNAPEVCAADGVARAAFGNGDMAYDLGADGSAWPALLHARSAIITASAAAGIARPLDGATTSLSDQDVLRADSLHARTLGFTGRICVHPAQVALVNELFTPTADELAHARAVVETAQDGCVTSLGGKLVGKPMVERAKQLLRIWEDRVNEDMNDLTSIYPHV